jgi:hypothetical protein
MRMLPVCDPSSSFIKITAASGKALAAAGTGIRVAIETGIETVIEPGKN